MKDQEENQMNKLAVAAAIGTMDAKRQGLGKDAGPWGTMEYKTAIEALHKQLPKRPMVKLCTYGELLDNFCVVCGAPLGGYGYDRRKKNVRYCPECGQRLIDYEEL